MRLPRYIRITPTVRYEVFKVDPKHLDGDWGECDSVKKVIFINNTLSKSRVQEVLVHEVLHALEFEYNIPISHDVIEQLDVGIARLLRLNKIW